CVSLVAAPSPIALCAPPLLFPASTPTGLSTLSLHDALPICWHEAPGADRPFTPQVETDVDPDVGFALTRAKWPWILALGCVAGLIWIFLAYGTPFGHTDPLESEAQQTQAVRASSITEFSSEQPTAPRIRRSGLVGPHLAQPPASPWLDERAMMVLTPPDEPLSQVAESLSPEWRVAVL